MYLPTNVTFHESNLSSNDGCHFVPKSINCKNVAIQGIKKLITKQREVGNCDNPAFRK